MIAKWLFSGVLVLIGLIVFGFPILFGLIPVGIFLIFKNLLFKKAESHRKVNIYTYTCFTFGLIFYLIFLINYSAYLTNSMAEKIEIDCKQKNICPSTIGGWAPYSSFPNENRLIFKFGWPVEMRLVYLPVKNMTSFNVVASWGMDAGYTIKYENKDGNFVKTTEISGASRLFKLMLLRSMEPTRKAD